MRPVLAVLVLMSLDCRAQTQSIQVKTDTSATFQTVDGCGASDAWRCRFVGKNWPPAKREQTAEWLFSREFDAQGNPQGIGLSI